MTTTTMTTKKMHHDFNITDTLTKSQYKLRNVVEHLLNDNET